MKGKTIAATVSLPISFAITAAFGVQSGNEARFSGEASTKRFSVVYRQKRYYATLALLDLHYSDFYGGARR
jgi:hypothetical protein